jgi:hypothetical protein
MLLYNGAYTEKSERNGWRKLVEKSRIMVTRSALKTEIDNLREEDLGIVYGILKSIIRQSDNSPQQTFMAKLKQIKIQGAPAFSRNIEHYLKQQGKPVVPGFPGMGQPPLQRHEQTSQ